MPFSSHVGATQIEFGYAHKRWISEKWYLSGQQIL
uniref:Uncharacterized protein n=1 Tax=Manihot esculenta TaxID=3983 RepID=A0A2C9V3L9_MANES